MAMCNTSYKTIDDAIYDYDAICVRHLSHQTVMRSEWGERRVPSLQELHISLSFDEKHCQQKHISGFDSLEEGDI